MRVAADSTNVTTYFKLVDPSTGDEEIGLTITDLDMVYIRDRATAVKADATALAAADSAHGDNKMYEVDGTNAPGVYRADWPDAAFATGVDKVQLVVKGANIDTAIIECELGPTPLDSTIPTATAIRQEMDSNSTQLAAILTKMLKYVQLLARSDAAIATDNATELTAINADGGSGAGDYSNQTEANEALRNRGDSAWITATGFSTHNAAAVKTAIEAAGSHLALILEDTGITLPATLSTLATAAALSTVDNVVDAIKAKTDNLPSGVAKGVALSNFPFFMVDSSDDISGKTELTVTAQVSKDGGAFANCTNSASEVGNGVYKINLTATEMNADTITLKFTATGANQTTISLVTDA